MTVKMPLRMSLANRGRGLEQLVLNSQSRATVLLTQVPQAAKRIGGGKVVTVRSSCDFFGIYAPTRQLIVFDCKTCALPHRLDTREAHLPEHQRLEILRYGEAGAIAGILAERSPYTELFWVPWQLLTTREPSIPWAAMVPIGSAKFAIQWQRFCGSASGETGVEA